MAISIDYFDIKEAMTKFDLEETDYYLEFTDDVIYMYWVACPADVDKYFDHLNACLDLQAKGKWIPLEEIMQKYTERPFVNCRYILATN